uniref:Uncharacterized protein n=1 Tax=Pararge aegeria TaxID=116150 RepID=S4PT58_9NEOP
MFKYFHTRKLLLDYDRANLVLSLQIRNQDSNSVELIERHLATKLGNSSPYCCQRRVKSTKPHLACVVDYGLKHFHSERTAMLCSGPVKGCSDLFFLVAPRTNANNFIINIDNNIDYMRVAY